MKPLLLITGLVFLGFGTSAQIAIKPAIGINFTDFSKNPDGTYKSKTGYQFGGSVAFGKKFYVEPGVFYVKKSTQYTSSNSSSNDVDFNLSGIRIPLTVGYNFLGNEKSIVGLHALGGVSCFILTNTEVKNTDISKDDFKNAAWGLYAGAGLDISIVFVDLQYEWSLTNIQKDISQVDVGKTRSFFINAGVRIPL